MPAASAILDLRMCFSCARKYEVSAAQREGITQAFAAQEKDPPDFKRMTVQTIRLEGPEFLAFEKKLAGRPN